MFARCGYDVSVQYGANQLEYDFIAVFGDKILKVSVKGWELGINSKILIGRLYSTYHEAGNMNFIM
jgi:hypothetical protein